MKGSLFAFSCLSVSVFLQVAPFSTPSALAQCVQFDQGIQVSISGGGPAQQSNNVEMLNQKACSRNSVVTTGEQIYVGPHRAIQDRNVRQVIRGNSNSRFSTNYPIQIQVNPKINVDNPADRIDTINNPALRYREQLRLIE